MEQQCKSGGLSLRNRDVVNGDRISELHEASLVSILSLLPTKSVVATSVLSKRWRYVWKMVQNLNFDSKYHRKFSEDVYRFFNFHKAPFLESLHLKSRDKRDALDVGILIGIAFARHVRKLVLDLDYVLVNDVEGSIRFPSVLCSCDNNTLETLTLKHSFLLDFTSRVCLKSLRKLHLYHVKFKDEESFNNLLCGCPNLEDLLVHRRNADVATFTIDVPSLQRLTIENLYREGGYRVGGYVINSPALKYLNINGFNGLEFFLIEKAPELVEAKISNVSYMVRENIMISLTTAKRLSLHLSPSKIKYPVGNLFHRLVYLELRTDYKMWWDQRWYNLLSLMLDHSPKLQILKLIDPYHFHEKGFRDDLKWNQPKCVPECMLFHLETFVWTGYECQREDEKEVATYILKYARQLRKATFSTKGIRPETLEKFEKRRETLNELASVVRASNSCHLVFDSI